MKISIIITRIRDQSSVQFFSCAAKKLKNTYHLPDLHPALSFVIVQQLNKELFSHEHVCVDSNSCRSDYRYCLLYAV